MTSSVPISLLIADSGDSGMFKKTTAGLSEVLIFVEKLEGLYGGIQHHYTTTKEALTPEQAVLLQSVMTSRHQFVLGILTLLRGHLGDSFGYLRKAIEFTIFAANVLEKENTAAKWLSAGAGDDQWNEYLAAFKIMKMMDPRYDRRQQYWTNLIADLPRLDVLIEHYDVASRRLHATVLSAGPDWKDGGLVFYEGYTDYFALEEPKKLIGPYFLMLQCHLDILHVQARVLLRRSGVKFDEPGWIAAFEPIEKQLNATQELWEESETTN